MFNLILSDENTIAKDSFDGAVLVEIMDSDEPSMAMLTVAGYYNGCSMYADADTLEQIAEALSNYAAGMRLR